VLSLLDAAWQPSLSVEAALALADAGIAEIRSRLVVAPPSYVVKIVDKDGARVLAERRSTEVVNTS
jgi:20S proteasome subunit beta 4